MLRALRSGEIDALVIADQIYNLESADAASNRFRGEVLEQINEVVIALDNNQRLTYLNPAAERQYNVDASQVLGRKLSHVYEYAWLTEEDEAQASLSLADKGFWRGENIHRLPSGEVIQVESLLNVLRDRSGEPMGQLAVIRNIGERKASEAALQQARDDLERRVEERTAELAAANTALHAEIRARESIERQRLELLKKLVTSQEDERRRIARDVHDHLGQRVTALRMQIEAFGDLLSDQPRFARRIETLKDTAENLDRDVSFLAWELRPASLDDLGLTEAVRDYLKDWSIHYQVPVDLNVRGFANRRLVAESETHLYRILQESLHNVVKHAEAAQVNVLLEWGPGEVTMIVEDDGKGFETDSQNVLEEPGHSLGLLGMQERAALIGGTIEIESNLGSGTTVYARVPGLGMAMDGQP